MINQYPALIGCGCQFLWFFCCPSFSSFGFIASLNHSVRTQFSFFLIIHCLNLMKQGEMKNCFKCFLFCPVHFSFRIKNWQWNFFLFAFIYLHVRIHQWFLPLKALLCYSHATITQRSAFYWKGHHKFRCSFGNLNLL